MLKKDFAALGRGEASNRCSATWVPVLDKGRCVIQEANNIRDPEKHRL